MEQFSTVTQSAQIVEDINLLSNFLADSQLSSLSTPIIPETTTTTIRPSVLILAGSGILDLPSAVFKFFQTSSQDQSGNHTVPENRPHSSISTLLLTGGIGHSTVHLYDTILSHQTYSKLPSLIGRPARDLSGLAEARLFYLIFIHFHDGEHVMKRWNGGHGLKVIVEDESTNCGANAVMSKVVLDRNAIFLGGRETNDGDGDVDDVIIVQDPTMSLRTKASFEKAYEDQIRRSRIRFWNWPVVLPVVRLDGASAITWDKDKMTGVDTQGLWSMKRFFGLILGEIPRLRNDENGYGPKGKGFIAHVDIPSCVEDAWERLHGVLDHHR